MPFATNGVKIQFKSGAPTPNELVKFPHINPTLQTNWNPTKFCLGQMSTSPGESSVDLLDTCPCPCAILLASLGSVNSQVSRSECDATLQDIPLQQSCSSSNQHSKVSAKVLADRFAIGIDQARATSKATHQKGTTGSAMLPLGRRHGADCQHLGERLLNARFATDTSRFELKSVTGNIGSQIFSLKSGFDCLPHSQTRQ